MLFSNIIYHDIDIIEYIEKDFKNRVENQNLMSGDNTQNIGSKGLTSEHVSRRAFVGAVGTASIFGGTAVAKSSDTITIPYVKNGDEVLLWKEVPKSWYQQVQQAKLAKKKVASEFLNQTGVIGVSRGRGKTTYGGKPGHRVHIHVDPDVFNGKSPGRVRGVNVKFVERDQGELLNCVHYDDFDDVQGGITNEAYWEEDDEGYIGVGTTCLRVGIDDEENDNHYMLTANHLWPDNCSESTNGITLQNGTQLGIVAGADVATDIALTYKTNDSKTLEDGINDESFNWSVSGYYTESSVDDMYSEGRSNLRSMGVTTGLTQGALDEIGFLGSGCLSYNGAGVILDADGGEGDSGGPMYGLEEYFGSQWAVMLGVVSQGFYKKDTVSCTAGVAQGNDRDVFHQHGGIGWHYLEDNTSVTIS